MNKKTDALSAKVSQAADTVLEEMRQTTERVVARVEDMRRRIDRQSSRPRRVSESGLRAVPAPRGGQR